MLHDVIGGHQAYIHEKIDLWQKHITPGYILLFMAHRILQLAKTTRS